MTSFRSRRWAVLWLLAIALQARAARADVTGCSALSVETDAAVSERWPGLVREIRGYFASRSEVERCARVTLALRHGQIQVAVISSDGRSAARRVAEREDIVPLLEALLIVPPADAASEPAGEQEPLAAESSTAPELALSSPKKTPATPKPRRAEPVARQLSPAGTDRDAAAAGQPAASSHFRIELSAVTAARAGDGQASLSLGALSLLDFSSWLVGFEGRGESYSGDRPQATLQLGMLIGKRVQLRAATALDLLAGPAVLQQGSYTFQSNMMVPETRSGRLPRLVVASHLNLGQGSVLRGFIGIEGQIGPPGGDDTEWGPPPLPIWMMGLALGGTVGSR